MTERGTERDGEREREKEVVREEDRETVNEWRKGKSERVKGRRGKKKNKLALGPDENP